ncbi:MAG: uroporphyrinogen-III C-methyltransferase [Lachnospiraceae bacterium]|nr:uroporphyrinogen-III C-methyltransferase [Lachnospiraceae bacterium]
MSGSVTLVGAGCGHDLITIKGLKAIREADVLVYDDLIDMNLLSEVKPGAEKLYVGKRRDKHSEEQESINDILVRKAKEGHKVVRLKGGDSFVFGRGGEEILSFQEAGIPYAVIPGVTSAVAVPEHTGIPITHRGVAQSVTLITGHTATSKEENYNALAQLDGTLVFLMGLKNTKEITDKLMANGKNPDTPAAILSEGFTAREKRYNGTLKDIAEKAQEAQTPAILVVGDTADYHMERTIRGPLDGVSINVIGTDQFVGKLSGKLDDLEADVRSFPCLKVSTVTEGIEALLKEEGLQEGKGSLPYHWILFTSANGVSSFFQYLFSQKIDIRILKDVKFACIGAGTGDKLWEYGIRTDFEPTKYTARVLGQEIVSHIKEGEKALILRAENGSPDLAEELTKANISFKDVIIYRTSQEDGVLVKLREDVDYTVFASGYGVETYFKENSLGENTTPVCIGPTTEKALRKYYDKNYLVATDHTADGIVETILSDRQK